jgi:hypothetical protein
MRIAAVVGMVGCSAGATDATRYTTTAPSADTGAVEIGLHINVFPGNLLEPDDPTTYRVLPQTFEWTLGPGESEVVVGALELTRPVQQIGTVLAYEINPQAIALPGGTVPVAGTLRVSRPDTVQEYVVRTDEFGGYEVWAIPQAEYRVQIVPDDPLLPMLTSSMDVTDPPGDRNFDLGVGVPIYGKVTVGGFAMSGARVRALDEFGVTSATAIANNAGLYQIRVSPGTWRLVTDGRDNGIDPALDLGSLTVAEPGAVVDVQYPLAPTALVGGKIETSAGEPLEDAIVRLTLEASPAFDGLAASWSGEDVTPANGRFLLSAVAGTYTVEVLPPPGEPLSPVRIRSYTIPTDGAGVEASALDPVRLPSFVTVSGQVVVDSPDAPPLDSAHVSCTEIGFGGRVFDAFTDAKGLFSIDVPLVPLDCEIAPPSTSDALVAAHVEIDPSQATSGYRVALPLGTLVTGAVLFEGEEEPFAFVEVRDANDVLLGTGLTGVDGRFEVRVDLTP